MLGQGVVDLELASDALGAGSVATGECSCSQRCDFTAFVSVSIVLHYASLISGLEVGWVHSAIELAITAPEKLCANLQLYCFIFNFLFAYCTCSLGLCPH